MALSQGNVSSGPFGLTMRAWGLINGATGALVSGQGMAGSSRSSAGNYAFTLSSALASTSVLVVVRPSGTVAAGSNFYRGTMNSTTVGIIYTEVAGIAMDMAYVHVEVWE